MLRANAFSIRHQALADTFTGLAQARESLPVFVIEHGLDDAVLSDLRQSVSRLLEADPNLEGAAWSWSYLPLLVLATEVGYRYRGTGTDFWPVLAAELGTDAGPSFRSRLSELFELGHRSFNLARPGESPWERHFPHISWPIGNSIVPLEIQPQLTDALRRAVRAGVYSDDPDRLLEYITALASGHSSRRFENWLLQRDVAAEVMRRLLAPDSDGWLSKAIVERIDRDIRLDRGAFRAIVEARRAAAKRLPPVRQITRARYVLALVDSIPVQLLVRGPALASSLREEVASILRINGDRLGASNSDEVVSLAYFLAGGEIDIGPLRSFPESPLRGGYALDLEQGAAKEMMERLQPLQPEFFVVEPCGRKAGAVFPEDRLQPNAVIIQYVQLRENGTPETRTLHAANPTDADKLRRYGFEIIERRVRPELLGLQVPGSRDKFFAGFPILAKFKGVSSSQLLLDGSRSSVNEARIGDTEWAVFRPGLGAHRIELADGDQFDAHEFEVIDAPDTEPASIKILPSNADVSDLVGGRIEVRIAAPIPIDTVRIRIRLYSADEPMLMSEGVIDRLPCTLTGRSSLLQAIQAQLVERQASSVGLRLSVDVDGLFEQTIALAPVRRELLYDAVADRWTSKDDDSQIFRTIVATADAPLLSTNAIEATAMRLVIPDAEDHEAMRAGIVLSGTAPIRLGPRKQNRIALPEILREPISNDQGVGLVDLARAFVAWQLAEAKDLFGNWHRLDIVEKLESALVEQLCGFAWRKFEQGIDLSIVSQHGALLRSAETLGLISGTDLPAIEAKSDRIFLRDRLIARFREAIPYPTEALVHWDDELAANLDLAVIDAYEDLRSHLLTNGIEAFDEVDMSRPAELWREAIERSSNIRLLPMFRTMILPETRWSALVKPLYGEMSIDDLVNLLDYCHVDSSRRSGLRWLGRSELRTMLELWISPKALVETEDWRNLLSKALSDVRTSRAVRYVALRRKIALNDLPDESLA